MLYTFRKSFKILFTEYGHFLQFKERDELDMIFKSWIQTRSSSPERPAPIMSKAWDYRVRQHLGTRYDSKKGCFDWDLTMKLHEKGVSEYFLHIPLVWPEILQIKCWLKKFKYMFVYWLSAVWRHQQTAIHAMEGTGTGIRNEGRRLSNN